MSGNVLELCWVWYWVTGKNWVIKEVLSKDTPFTGPAYNYSKRGIVIRGGDNDSYASSCEVTNRFNYERTYAYCGLRVVRTVTE